MPKVIDSYILERKISSGQFGEVYKGYNKVNNLDVAIKVIKRDNLQGKLIELLENEIRVLRTCDNMNIMKLYDLKKTSNNYYLMLEYCNEGDLGEYAKEKGILSEEEVTYFLLQILNGFKDLVKNNIMHRDLKLPNILKHNGNIKLADFGFAKLLGKDDYASTILGSPLNMAPEVLDGLEYNNKADIWSIGICTYELLFGKTPYTADNIIELVKTIKTKPLEFPRKINNISKVCEDVLRKMLVVDPDHRIDWESLFNHPINFYQEEKLRKELDVILQNQGLSLSLNMSKFYIKNSKVINHPAEIKVKQNITKYAVEAAKGKQHKFKGPLLNRQTNRKESNEIYSPKQQGDKLITDESTPNKGIHEEEKYNNELNNNNNQESKREKLIRIIKSNSNRLLHERNKYVFLASVAEDALKYDLKYSNLVAFLLVKKLFSLLTNMKLLLVQKMNIFSLDEWETYTKTKEYSDILEYISQEYQVFQVYLEGIYEIVLEANLNGVFGQLDEDTLSCINLDLMQSFEKVFQKRLSKYCKSILNNCLKNSEFYDELTTRAYLQHTDQIADCIRFEFVFQYNTEAGTPLNFIQFYEETNSLDLQELFERVQLKLKKI